MNAANATSAVGTVASANPYVAVAKVGFETAGQIGSKMFGNPDLVVDKDGRPIAMTSRGPPPKQSVSMVKYMAIAIGVVLALLVMFLIFQQPLKAQEAKSIWGFTQPARPVSLKSVHPHERDRVFGVIPLV